MSTTLAQKMESEDQETLIYHAYPCAYYVQSPSTTISHANSATDIRHAAAASFESASHYSPTRSETNTATNKNNNSNIIEVSRLNLSRYSSSRGSNNSFSCIDLQQEKKVTFEFDDDHDHGSNGKNRLIIVDHHGDDDDDDEDDDDDDGWFNHEGRRGGLWWRYFSFRRSNSCAWISLQITWRLLLSLGVALLVFYTATKPPSPKLSIKMAGIRQFRLGEGVDRTGVTTKILTCNCSIHLIIDNKSKLFGLHIQPPTLDMSFSQLPFALSHGPKLYAESHGSTVFELYVGTTSKPMYGAGRNMQDMLDSRKGLPLTVHISFKSNYRVVWDLIKPTFRHKAECLLLLHKKYDKKHQTQTYNSTCTITT